MDTRPTIPLGGHFILNNMRMLPHYKTYKNAFSLEDEYDNEWAGEKSFIKMWEEGFEGQRVEEKWTNCQSQIDKSKYLNGYTNGIEFQNKERSK